MKNAVFAILLIASPLIASPSLAQTNLAPRRTTAARVDNCAPIGRTADGKLVYSLKCDNMPAPPPPSAAELQQAAPPVATEPEVQRGGIFGLSYSRKNPNE